MSRAFLFRAKCDLVQALVTAGFALHHDVFVSKACIPRRKSEFSHGMNMKSTEHHATQCLPLTTWPEIRTTCKALQLHNRFEPATDRELQNYFEGWRVKNAEGA